MSDNEDYFYSPAGDYYSDDDQSYLYSPPPGSLSYIIKHPPAPLVTMEPGEGSASFKAMTDKKNKAHLVEEVKESPTSAAAMPELDSKKENKEEDQNETESEGKKAVDDVESEIMPAKKKAKTI